MRFTFKEKNLILGQQIFSFKSLPQLRKEVILKIAELLPMEVYPFNFKLITQDFLKMEFAFEDTKEEIQDLTAL